MKNTQMWVRSINLYYLLVVCLYKETGIYNALESSHSYKKYMEKEWIQKNSYIIKCQNAASQFSHSVVSNSLWPHGLQHARLPCPSSTPGTCSNSCPSSWWCHPTILSSVAPFSSCLQSFPASRFFPVSQLFASGGQHIGASASASVLPMSIQGWFPLGWTGG